MELRGYGSKTRTYLHKFELRLADWVALALMLVVTIAGVVVAITGYGRMVIPQ